MTSSIRRFKKDIDFIVEEIIVECFVYNSIFPNKNEEELTNIISDTLKMGKELKEQVQDARKSGKQAKAKFREIRINMHKLVKDLATRLDNLGK